MDKFIYYSTPSGRRAGKSFIERLIKEAREKEDRHLIDTIIKQKASYILRNHLEETQPISFGIDWAKDSGRNRGDVIKRVGNVTHVRFKTMGVR